MVLSYSHEERCLRLDVIRLEEGSWLLFLNAMGLSLTVGCLMLRYTAKRGRSRFRAEPTVSTRSCIRTAVSGTLATLRQLNLSACNGCRNSCYTLRRLPCVSLCG